MNKIQIKSRFNDDVLFEHNCENNSMKLTLESAVKASAGLRFADLRGANLIKTDLCGADLRGADLRDTDLCEANLGDAELEFANLSESDLCNTYLRDADLQGADLSESDLRGANLRGAYLKGANLSETDLCGADLRDANLFKANLYGAYLCGAIIEDGFICDGKFHHITNVGSGGGTLELYSCGEAGWYIKHFYCGGGKQEFLDAITMTYGDNEYSRKYRAIVELFCGE